MEMHTSSSEIVVLRMKYHLCLCIIQAIIIEKSLKGNIVQNNIKDDINYVDIDYLFSKYKEFLLENGSCFEHYIGLDYTYNYFSNGAPLISFYRRIFRACLNKDRDSWQSV